MHKRVDFVSLSLAVFILMPSIVLAQDFANMGTVIAVIGQPQLLRAGQQLPIAKGDALREGDELYTAEQSSVYLRTIDQGFIALRPNSVLLIEKYRLGSAAAQFKFQLKTGLMRSVTGKEVQKDKYRLNTPVAAIGLRGTDFVVQASEQLTQVAVLKGGVVIEGYSGACLVEQAGPCQGANSRELFASTAHMLEVMRGQAVPVKKDSSPVLQKELQKELPKEVVKGATKEVTKEAVKESPKETTQETVKEPSVSSAANGAKESKDSVKPLALGAESAVQNAVDLSNAVAKTVIDSSKLKPAVSPAPIAKPSVPEQQVQAPTPAPTPAPLPVEPPKPLPSEPVVVPPVTASIHWGRWQELANLPATASFTDVYKAGQEVVTAGIYYVMSRDNNNQQYGPELGLVNFKMAKHDGILVNTLQNTVTPTLAKESALQINFAAQSFTTYLLLNANGREIPVNVKGAVESNGLFLNGAVSEVQLRGVVSGKEAAEAGYVYYSAPAANEILSGGTYWLRKK